MFELTLKMQNPTILDTEDRKMIFVDRKIARQVAGLAIDCEDIYCVELVDARTGELLFYEMKN